MLVMICNPNNLESVVKITGQSVWDVMRLLEDAKKRNRICTVPVIE